MCVVEIYMQIGLKLAAGGDIWVGCEVQVVAKSRFPVKMLERRDKSRSQNTVDGWVWSQTGLGWRSVHSELAGSFQAWRIH